MADAKGETTGEGETDKLLKYGVYCQMLADWFNEPQEQAIKKVEKFEQAVKKKFIDEPGQDEAADCGGQTPDRLRRAFRHLPLHRQGNARPRPVPSHLPRQLAGRRDQGSMVISSTTKTCLKAWKGP